MEQRNGRIDRHGQKASEVRIYHFVGKGYKQREQSRPSDIPAGELEGDLEFLMRAARKVNQIREDLGKVGPVIAQQVEDAMLGRRTRLDTVQAEKDAEPVRKLLRFERDLRKQIQRLRDQLDETQRELRLSPDNIQKVVEVGLQLAGQPPLIPTQVKGIWPNPKRQECPRVPLAITSKAVGNTVPRVCDSKFGHTNKIRPTSSSIITLPMVETTWCSAT